MGMDRAPNPTHLLPLTRLLSAGFGAPISMRPQSRTLEKITGDVMMGYSWSPDGSKVAYDAYTLRQNRLEGLLRQFYLDVKLAALAT